MRYRIGKSFEFFVYIFQLLSSLFHFYFETFLRLSYLFGHTVEYTSQLTYFIVTMHFHFLSIITVCNSNRCISKLYQWACYVPADKPGNEESDDKQDDP